MLYRNKNEQGFALVYALAALLIVTIGGTALLFMVRKDRNNTTDYSSMRATAKAAESALKACESQFMDHPDTALAILKAFTKNNNCKWICNPSVASAVSEVRYVLNSGNGTPKYSAKIVSFDSTAALVTIEGTGFGDFGVKKKALALYKLDGIEVVSTAAAVTSDGKYAIYLRKDGENFNQPMTVNGNVYFGGKFVTENPFTITITGNVKTGVSAITSEAVLLNTWVINGNALFMNPIEISNGTLTINGKAGFNKNVDCKKATYSIIMNDDAFFNSTINGDPMTPGSNKVDMKNHVFTHSGSANVNYVDNKTIVDNNGAIDLASKVGICTGPEDPLSIDTTPLINSGKVKNYADIFGQNGNLTATTLNSYISANSNALYNGWLTVRIRSSNDWPNFNTTDATPFNGKVIWLVYYALGVNQKWYTSSASARTLIYVARGGTLNPIGWSGRFNGVIYVTGTCTGKYSFVAGSSFYGSLIHASAGADFEVTNTNSITFTYDDTIIQELVTLGIATRPPTISCGSGGGGGGGGGGASQLKLVDLKIRPRLLSMQL